MQIDSSLAAEAAQVIKAAQSAGLTIVTAESCTAGLLSNLLSLAPGAGKQLQGGFVTYTKEAKTRVLGVPAGTYAAEKRAALKPWAEHIKLVLAQAGGANVSRLADRRAS